MVHNAFELYAGFSFFKTYTRYTISNQVLDTTSDPIKFNENIFKYINASKYKYSDFLFNEFYHIVLQNLCCDIGIHIIQSLYISFSTNYTSCANLDNKDQASKFENLYLPYNKSDGDDTEIITNHQKLYFISKQIFLQDISLFFNCKYYLNDFISFIFNIFIYTPSKKSFILQIYDLFKNERTELQTTLILLEIFTIEINIFDLLEYYMKITLKNYNIPKILLSINGSNIRIKFNIYHK